MSNFLKLNLGDLSKGLVVAILVAVLQILLNLLQSKGLGITGSDLSNLIDISLKAGAAYLLKNLFSDSNGLVLGMIGNKPVNIGNIGEKGNLE